jgi:hypothetical protein
VYALEWGVKFTLYPSYIPSFLERIVVWTVYFSRNNQLKGAAAVPGSVDALDYADVLRLINGLSAEEKGALYLWAVSCGLGCSFTEMEDIYTEWYGESRYMEILGRLGKELGGLFCNRPVRHGDGSELISSLLLSIESELHTAESNLSSVARGLLEYLIRSGLFEKFAQRRVVELPEGTGVEIGYALPYTSLEHCFMYHHRALGNELSIEDAHAAVRELVRARLMIRCSSAGQDRYYIRERTPPQA